MAVLVDSNVLLDVMTEDTRWFPWSSAALAAAADVDRVIINAMIYGEVSVRFSRIEDLEDALYQSSVEREAIPYEAAFLAGKVYVAYRRHGGVKRSPLPDFYIGAHAAVAGYRLLTRDTGRYRSYFPNLSIIAP
jgi:hypothetical protein